MFVWERGEDKIRTTKVYDAPYYFYSHSADGPYMSMYGDSLERYDFQDEVEFYSTRKSAKLQGYELFESDIPCDLKVLSEHYYKAKAPELNVTFYDIEVDYKTTRYDGYHKVKIRNNELGETDNISVNALRNYDDIDAYDAWDEKLKKWVTARTSEYMYNGPTGFSSPLNPYAEVNAVALAHTHRNEMVVIAIPPTNASCNVPKLGKATSAYIKKMNDIAPLREGVDIRIEFVETEEELLKIFLKEIEDSDIICGWNNSGFDDPYVGKRLELMGNRYFKKLSFLDASNPTWRMVEMYGKEQPVIDLKGRVSLDYLTLFKKYMVENQASYKLDNIADKFLRTDGKPDMPKLEYEGSLAGLYKNDFDYFVRYNIRDTEILLGFEDKFKFVNLANEMVHGSTGQFKHVGGSIKLIELEIINHMHERGMISIDSSRVDWDGHKIQGALVHPPVVGMHKMIGSIDLASLYPSVIRMNNISPETFVGQFTNKEEDAKLIRENTDRHTKIIFKNYKNEKTISKTAMQWHEWLIDKEYTLSGFGSVFSTNKDGIIPDILTRWYSDRKKYQKEMRNCQEKAQHILDKYKNA